MGRTPCIPPELTRRPFTLDEARDVGLTLSALSSKAWQRIGAELYRWTELPEDPWLTLSAWRRLLPQEAVFVGATAGWLHGLDLEPANPVEVAVPPTSRLRSRGGLVVRRCEIPAAEVVPARRLPATALAFTLAGLCLQRPAVEALIVVDMALRRGLGDSAALCRYANASKGRPGVAWLRSLAWLATPAESPMETRLRWLLMQAGLPRPEVQTNLRDGAAKFVGRADLYYPASRLVIEYSTAATIASGWSRTIAGRTCSSTPEYRLLRFTASDIHKRADVVVAQVRAALEAG